MRPALTKMGEISQRTLAIDTVSKIGRTVKLAGWVNTRRDHGQLIFIDLRDRSGIVQIVGGQELDRLRPEDVIEIEGRIKKRPATMDNPNLSTGKIEIEAKKCRVLSAAKTPPFPLDSDGYDIDEELRLRYRYLDLRRPRLQKNLRFRSEFIRLVRQYLYQKDFVEIETPLLTKSTPEGSRDFIVPSRLQPGKFYALPQSPQQYKQLLMAAGFERYFQIAKALRDEDLRADRGFEHTQIDMEMSFVKREEVMRMTEGLMTTVFEKMGAKILKKPFPVYTHQEALKKFGADKFDLRSLKEKEKNIQAFAWVIGFPFFEKDKDGQWTYTHNPFSDPVPEDKQAFLDGKIQGILTTQYDLICNGFEVGGGSIRSTDAKILSRVFAVLGHRPKEIKEKFGHMLEAFRFGVPPHGGIAPGIERLLMCLLGEDYLREVVAFPMTAGGRTAVMEAPSHLAKEQLDELGITIIAQKDFQDAFRKLVDFLEKNQVEYKIIEHPPVYTSEEAAKIRKTKLSQGAKALIMFADKKAVMLVLPADRKVDVKKFKQLNKIHHLQMANTEEVKKISGVQIGAVHPFGNLFNLPLYVDKSLGKNEKIVFNAGLHTKSLIIDSSDYLKLCRPTIVNFSSPTKKNKNFNK